MSGVFESSFLGPIAIANRIIRSATAECLADEEGKPTERLTKVYVRLARGGVGAIITSQAGIHKSGRLPIHRCLMIDRDEAIPDFRRMTDEVHAHGTAIIAQIGHAGRQTRSAVTGMETVAPSSVRDFYWNEARPRALTEGEIEEIVASFVRAIERAREAGFDGVQLHAAHGWLLSQFLSPHTNRRKDRWGGTTENRFRIVERIFRSARRRVGDYPILVKMNAYEGRRRGIKSDEALRISSLLENVGCAGIEVSCGIGDDGLMSSRVPRYPVEASLAFSFRLESVSVPLARTLLRLAPLVKRLPRPLDNYNVAAAREIKRRVGLPVIVVGGIRRLADIEQIIERNAADYVSLSRPFIIEPDIVDRLRQGRQDESRCISCGYCLLSLEKRPLRCYRGKLGSSASQ